MDDPELIDSFEEYENKFIFREYKFGILNMKKGQNNEDQLYSNGMKFQRIFSSN